MKKPFSETPAAYAVSSLAGIVTGGPIGGVLSPLCLLAVNKSIEAPEGATTQKPSKRWINWVGIGVIGGPASWILFAMLMPAPRQTPQLADSKPSISAPAPTAPPTSTAPPTPTTPPTPVPKPAPQKTLPFTPSVAPPRPNTENPILLNRWRKRVAEVKIENDPEAMNQPRNGGTTTLAQKCEARHGGDLSDSFNLGFQIGFEHEYGSLSIDEACRRVNLMGLK